MGNINPLGSNRGNFTTPVSNFSQTSCVKDRQPLIGGGLVEMHPSSSATSGLRKSSPFGFVQLSSTNHLGKKHHSYAEDDPTYRQSNLQLSHLDQLATQQKSNTNLLKRKIANLQDVIEEDEQAMKKLRLMLNNKLLHTPTKVHGVNE